MTFPRKAHESRIHNNHVNSRKSSGDFATEKPLLADQAVPIPLNLQQAVLNIFTSAFSKAINDDLSSKIQHVKQHLFNRDFSQAFGSEELLEAYALRWSPSRALAYLDLFQNLPSLSSFLTSRILLDKPSSRLGGDCLEVVCLGGGGGAEMVALASFLHLQDNGHAHADSIPPSPAALPNPTIKCKILDIADWSSVIQGLYASVTEIPPISQYASSVAKAANRSLCDCKGFAADFMQQDVLNMNLDTTTAEIFNGASLVTLMFTLNELYNTSIKSTTNLLLASTMLLKPGALLLVVDSPGSFSTVGLNVGEGGKQDSSKKYPMQWLLDHTLLEAASIGSSKNASSSKEWEKLESRESQWFRMANVKYPIDLEDMRYQVHLYRRLDSP